MTHYRACNLCEAMCGIAIEVEGDRVVSIVGDEKDPFSQGHICPKATALADIHHDPDRLKRPMKRMPHGGWVEITWDEAFDEATRMLQRIMAEHGPQSVGLYLGNPTVHNWGALLFGMVFAKALGNRSRFSATSVDQLPKMLASLEMFGHQLLLSIPDVDRTDYFLVFGANPVVSNGSIMTAPGMRKRIAAIRERGGKVVVFDPRRTETAELADEHVFVRPGTDALVLFAMLHTIFEEGLVRLDRLEPHVKGLETLRAATRDFAPSKVAPITGVPAETIVRIAREYARSAKGVAYGRVGVSMQEFGGIACWLLEAMNVVTGHFDREGGAMFTTPAVDLVKLGSLVGERGHHGKFESRVRGAPEFGGELPVAVLAEEIETPGPGRIRAMITHAGNPVLSTPNGRRLDAAFATLDYMVSIDIYLNETTRHANLILPPTFALEHDHYDVAFHALAVRNTAKYSPALFPRTAEQRHDWEILLELIARLGDGNRPVHPLVRQLRSLVGRNLEPKRLGDALMRLGPHGLRKGASGLTMAKVEASVHGLDLGPLEPCMPARLETRDRKIDLAPEKLVDDVARLRARADELASAGEGKLFLIGRRQLRSNNSWCHNSPRLVKGKDRCTLIVHPEDARERGLVRGEPARIRSRVGEVVAPVEISDEIMRGVVSLPHGFGHDREGTRWRVAEAHAGVSLNDLTDDGLLDALAGTASFSGVPVEVAKATTVAAAE